MSGSGFEDLPAHAADRLVVHLPGPGFGESVVVRFPDGGVMVIDACVRAGVNLPAALLKRLRIDVIDLLVITHPDLDHIRGVAHLLTAFSPRRVWCYPAARSLRDLLVRWTSPEVAEPWRRRLNDLRVAHEALIRLAHERNAVREVGAGHQFWPDLGGGGGYFVKCIAPTDYDQYTLERHLGSLLSVRGGRVEVDEKLAGQLLGERRPDDHPNTLSVALSVQWGKHRLLFAGDVENGDTRPFSGWKGVVDCLRQDARIELVQETSFVKVAHHGSRGAFFEQAWKLHAKADGSTVAFLTPFHRTTPPLPSADVLPRLLCHVSRLGITADARGAFARAIKAGWRMDVTPPSRRPRDGAVRGAPRDRGGFAPRGARWRSLLPAVTGPRGSKSRIHLGIWAKEAAGRLDVCRASERTPW